MPIVVWQGIGQREWAVDRRVVVSADGDASSLLCCCRYRSVPSFIEHLQQRDVSKYYFNSPTVYGSPDDWTVRVANQKAVSGMAHIDPEDESYHTFLEPAKDRPTEGALGLEYNYVSRITRTSANTIHNVTTGEKEKNNLYIFLWTQ